MPTFATPSSIEGRWLEDPGHLDPGLTLALVNQSPFIAQVRFGPGGTAQPHSHHYPTVYVVQRGSFFVGERWLAPGDVFWVAAGEVYGPEGAGPEGGEVLIISIGGPLGTDWV
jgi:quercetin dioxygenase-like cupin family protein